MARHKLFRFILATVLIAALTRTVLPVKGGTPSTTIFVTSAVQEQPFVNNGNCTLGEAIQAANTNVAVDACPAGADADVIELMAGETYRLTTVNNLTEGSNGLPPVSGEITINGNGATITRDIAAPSFRIFYARNTSILTLNAVTVSNGNIVSNSGGGVLSYGVLKLTNSTLHANQAELGGGIYKSGGTLEIVNSIIDGNRGGGIVTVNNVITTIISSTLYSNFGSLYGGGFNSMSMGGSIAITNSTFSNNRATQGGGGLANDTGVVTISNSTFSNNGAPSGGGIYNHSNTITLRNTIVANSISGGDCFVYGGAVVNGGGNLVEDNSCGFTGGSDPLLGPLADNGGSTMSHALIAGSPAIDAGNNAMCESADQRGIARPQGPVCDIGAYEVLGPAMTPTYTPFPSSTPTLNATSSPNPIIVNTADDEMNSDGDCSLREAITAANSDSAVDACLAGNGADTIELAAGAIYTLATIDNVIPGDGYDKGNNGLPSITSQITINGHGAVITCTGSADLRIFFVGTTGNLTLYALTLRDVNSGYIGGALYNNRGLLTISNSFVVNNVAVPGGGGVYNDGTLIIVSSIFDGNSAVLGGGVWSHEPGSLSVTNSTFSDNTATYVSGGYGGAIAAGGGTANISQSTFVNNRAFATGSLHDERGGALYNGGTMTISNSTFSGNSATVYGGGVYNETGPGTITISNSTFFNNSAGLASEVANNNSGYVVTLRNTIITNSSTNSNCSPSIADGGHNLDSSTSCGFNSANDSLSNVDPLLGPLADNGGPTKTHALLAGSWAINAGDNATCESIDQRGIARPQGLACDIGAFEQVAEVVISFPTITHTLMATPTYTPTLTPSPTRTPTSTYTNTPTRTPTFTPTSTFTPTASNTQTYTPSSAPTTTPTATPTLTETYTPTLTATATLTQTPVSTPSPTLPAPTLYWPRNSATTFTLRPLFDWSTVTRATSYTLQISTNSKFTSLVLNKNVSPSAYVPAADLSKGTTLFWRVRANSPNGLSAWSRVRHFTAPNPPSVPALLSPANNAATSAQLTLDWSDSSPGVDHYEVQLSTDPFFTTTLGRGRSGRTAVSQYTVESALAPNTYYWRVRAVNTAAHFSNWSSSRSFRVP